jgi:hypothetical protein
MHGSQTFLEASFWMLNIHVNSWPLRCTNSSLMWWYHLSNYCLAHIIRDKQNQTAIYIERCGSVNQLKVLRNQRVNLLGLSLWSATVSNGPTDFTGSTGSIGFTGSIGSTSFTGSIGSTGFTGSPTDSTNATNCISANRILLSGDGTYVGGCQVRFEPFSGRVHSTSDVLDTPWLPPPYLGLWFPPSVVFHRCQGRPRWIYDCLGPKVDSSYRPKWQSLMASEDMSWSVSGKLTNTEPDQLWQWRKPTRLE